MFSLKNLARKGLSHQYFPSSELCYNESQTEVELVSLIEEQIPRYVLRADTLTDFAGYDNSDWIQTPCLPLDSDLDLTPELIEETFKYFSEYNIFLYLHYQGLTFIGEISEYGYWLVVQYNVLGSRILNF